MWQVGGRVSSTAGASLTYRICEAKRSNNDQLLTKKKTDPFCVVITHNARPCQRPHIAEYGRSSSGQLLVFA